MGDPRRLALSDLRALVADPAELEKGVRIFDAGGLSLLSRHEGRLFCEAAGSGAAPYRVSVALEDAGARPRCSCMAARSRPFCKHAAALLVAWARAPEAFAVSDVPPPEPAAGGGARKRAVKTGKTDATALLRRGVEQAGTLVRELAVAGVASLATGRTEAIRGLAGALREARLRRLSARMLALADLLDAGQRGALDVPAYAGLLADMLLAVRKLEKHLGGEPLDPRSAEELLGKTWRKEDRVPVEGLDLVEYAFVGRETADGYVIRESRLLDLASGHHLAEKQILPAFLARRTDPLRSRAGQRLRDARGSQYPGYDPHRVDLDDGLAASPLDAEGVAAFVSRCLPGAGAALSAFAEHRRDPFAPDAFPVALRVDALLARDGRLLAMDADGAAVHLPADDALEERLAIALRSERLLAMAGDLDLEAALPVLTPLAVAVEREGGASLIPLGAAGEVLTPAPRLTSPLEAARRAGASGAAIVLAEVREELAQLLAAGLSGLVPRATDALAARLRDLQLAKPADLLDAVARRPEAVDRLDDLVKLYQVLELALLRLLGVATADRAALVASPTYESVLVPRPAAPLDPDEVGTLRASGRMSRYEAAWHLEQHHRSLPAEELAARIFTAWADGSASPFVIRACAGRGAEAVAAAERALALPTGRVAKLTALRVLEAVGGEAARAALAAARADAHDPLMRVEATAALASLVAREPPARPAGSGGVLGALRRLPGGGAPQDEDYAGALATRRKAVEADLAALRDASLSDDRVRLVEKLVHSGNRHALVALRAAAASDPAGPVRLAALRALGALCDVESVDALSRLLAARDRDEERAKAAADALGRMGDRRGIAPLVDAFADGWKPTVVGDALLAIGAPAIEPLVARLEQRPDLAARKVSVALLQRLPPADLSSVLLERLGSLRARLALRGAEAEWPAAAAVHLKVAAAHRETEVAVATAIASMLVAPATKEERALRRAAEKALSPPATA